MTRLLLACLLLACGGSQRDPAPETGDLEVAVPPRAPSRASTAPGSPSSSTVEATAASDGAARFNGRRIDIDVVDADLHNVFRLIADAGGASIAVADDVKGTITLRLRQVPWDQALDTVVRLEKLHLERRGDIYLVTRSMPENDHIRPRPQ